MADVSKLLYSQTTKCLLANLQLEQEDHAKLRDARRKIRQHLRKVFASISRDTLGVTVVPRFFTQGSYSYKTINDPAWVPPQQMDLDDGCYLPLTFVKGEKPSRAASAFFAIVDAALKDLARSEGWKFAEKPTCARLIIAEDAHVDTPLYAIPDKEFRTLEEAARADSTRIAKDIRIRASVDRWDALPSNCVLLAHREEDWISSDPRKIQDWFLQAVEVYGEKLRRVCRYLKAWRDYHRPELDPLSSIILMVCAWKAFEEIGRRNVPSRDDLALMEVADRLPEYLLGEIKNPSDSSERLDRRLSEDERRRAVAKAKELSDGLVEIREAIDAIAAIDGMTRLFGDRIPSDPALVSIAEAVTREVRRYPTKQVAAPTVGRSTSG